MLPVSAPFHSALMAPAADAMREALAKVTKNTPVVPVVANVVVKPISRSDEIAERLVEQVTGRVRWRETVEWFGANGVTTLYEVGSGKVLSGLARRINRDIATATVGTAAEVEAALAALGIGGFGAMFDLTGKKALVTGASGGIGEAIARVLHAQGADRRPARHAQEKLEALAGELGDRTKLFPANLSDRDAVKALAQKAEADLEGVDILVNNAGITKDGLFVRMSDADWDAVIEVNLTSVFRLTRELTHPMMRRRNGRIINITSVVGVTGNPGQANYCASKAGMIGFSKSLAQEIATRNVTVNCVAPGFIESAMTDKLNDKQKETIMAAIPARRMGTGAEVAAAVAFLASSEAAYVTGQTIHVNGGMAMI